MVARTVEHPSSLAARDPWRTEADTWISNHHGVISVSRARLLGVPERTLYSAVERGAFTELLPGVLLSGHWPSGRMQLMAAALARNPRAVIAFTTAASLWGFRRLPRDEQVHVLVPHGSSPKMAGVEVHRCRRIDIVDVTERQQLALTSPPRTLFDCADMLGFDAAASVLEQVIDRGWGTFDTHADTWIRLGRRRRPGTRTMAAVLRSRPAWRSALQSDLEARVLGEIDRQGLPAPVTQWPITLPGGRDIRIDFAWPELRVALEVDHPFWHAAVEHWQRDRSRDRELMRLGWTVPRITEFEVSAGLAGPVEDVAALLAARAAV
ncbi:MAG: hypothetical protein JWM12_332 [Ilumatobacteraceae bacterium]|nr:hypothetical protein [Ilumatobacteraceae bacterium]